ncbi:MAG: hypothetical protein KJP11_03305 [Gammaproteobacteria bacterium]|nr:hypothetical protein [Gammaproteobacteria bacterium]
MDFINECFNEHDGALVEQLKDAGFSSYRARKFLPEAASGILDSTRGSGVEQITENLMTGAPSQFLSSVNVAEIARKLGMSSDQVTQGLAVITPVLAQALSRKSNSLIGSMNSASMAFLAPGLYWQLG